MSMPKLAAFWLACVLLAAGCADAARAQATDRPVALAVDGATDPIGVDTVRPRLSWRPPVRRQSAWQVRVAASARDLATGELVWDSGRVASTTAVSALYEGPPLASRDHHVWQVRLWDERGRASPWSAPSSWEMGLLEPGDWTSRWIGRNAVAPSGWTDAVIDVDFTLTGPSFEVLFRARPIGKTYGEAYVWRIAEVEGRPVLLAQVRHYPGGTRSVVQQTVLKTVPLDLTIEALRQGPHRLTIETAGQRIVTRLDGAVIDEMSDAGQDEGTVGFVAPAPDAAIIHRLSVTSSDAPAFETTFADGANPLTGGSVGPDGLVLASGVPGKDIVLPLSNPAPLLRRAFDLDQGRVVSARLYVAAGGWADVTLNGRSLTDLAMAPGWTDYDKRVLYQVHDVTGLLTSGQNVVAAELGRGWYGVTEPNEWYFHQAPWHGEPVLRGQLEILFADGHRQIVSSDETWRTADGPTLHDSIYAGERYDARLEPEGWREARFGDADWSAAIAAASPRGALVAAAADPIRPVEDVSPVAVQEVKPGVWLFDFGRILSGRPRMKLSGAAGQTISLVLTEKRAPDGTALVASGLIDAQLQTYRYTFAGAGEEVWAPRFSYAGFRYVQVEGLRTAPAADAVVAQIIHSDVPDIGAFESGDDLLNRIQQASRNALLNNMHGLMSDTPSLEKNGWTGDGQASARAAAQNFGMSRVWRKWLADFRDAQVASGELPEIVPSTPLYGFDQSPGWSYIWGPTPAWDAAMFVITDELERHYGDSAILRDMYEAQKRLVDYTGGVIVAPDFTYSRGLGDYAGTGPFGPVDATSSAYYFFMVSTLARNAATLGEAGDAARYGDLASRIRDAYNRKYWDAATRRYVTPTPPSGQVPPYSQTQNVLPLAFGLVPEGEEQAVADSIAADLDAREGALTMGVYPLRYAMVLLSDHGHVDTAYRVATRTAQPSWGFWLQNDINSMLEGWGLGSRSWNHHYFASISDWFFEGLAGIRPAAPGYAKLMIRPALPRGLGHAAASIETPRGRVSSSWRRDGANAVLDVETPGAAEAEVWLPNGGDPVARAPRDARYLRAEDGHAVYAVAPGRAAFRFVPAL